MQERLWAHKQTSPGIACPPTSISSGFMQHQPTNISINTEFELLLCIDNICVINLFLFYTSSQYSTRISIYQRHNIPHIRYDKYLWWSCSQYTFIHFTILNCHLHNTSLQKSTRSKLGSVLMTLSVHVDAMSIGG